MTLVNFFHEHPEFRWFCCWMQVDQPPDDPASWKLVNFEPIPRDPEAARARNLELWDELPSLADRRGAIRALIALGCEDPVDTNPANWADHENAPTAFRHSLVPTCN